VPPFQRRQRNHRRSSLLFLTLAHAFRVEQATLGWCSSVHSVDVLGGVENHCWAGLDLIIPSTNWVRLGEVLAFWVGVQLPHSVNLMCDGSLCM
jgi:hypothetical protein